MVQEVLGADTLRLVSRLDPKLVSPSNLRDLLVSLRTRQGLLADSRSRELIFDLLRPGEATSLCNFFTVQPVPDPYRALKALPLSSPKKLKQLFEFFDVEWIEPEAATKVVPYELRPASRPLFKHQRDAARRVRQVLRTEPQRVLLHMPTGAGKTRTAMSLIADHFRNQEPTVVVWLAFSEELCGQAAEEFEASWGILGDREIQVVRYWGSAESRLNDVTDGIVIAGLAKLFQALKKDLQLIHSLGRRTSLVVMDEAHQAIAPSYRLVLDSFVMQHPSIGLLGLTATPGRTWSDVDSDRELAEYFGLNKVGLHVEGYSSPVEYLIAEQYLARPVFRSVYYDGGIELTDADRNRIANDFEIPSAVLERLAAHEQRNLVILAELERLAKDHKRILVFASSIQHSRLLAAVLRARGIDAYSVDGTTPAGERESTLSKFKAGGDTPRILCNFAVLTTGFDAPKTSAVVIARPTKSLVLYSQMVGRGIRGLKAGGNSSAEVVTVVDTQLPGFGSIVEAFHNWEDVWRSDA